MQKLRLALALIILPLLYACATLVGDESEVLPVASTPSGANISITDEGGQPVYRGRTPASVSLKNSTGKYWGGKSFKVALSKEGYATQTYSLETTPNGWYLAGNLIISGGIGWFLVDPFSGKMHSLASNGIDSGSDDAPGSRHHQKARYECLP